MTKRVVVTGGAGFIGSHVADCYLADGYQVTVLDDLSGGTRDNVPADAEFIHADVGSPEAREAVARGKFDVLNHHAAQMDVRVSVADPAFDARVNIMGLLNLLEGAREGGTQRVVFASSGGVVYGESGDLPHREQAPKLPLSPYGVSKLASEYYLAVYAQLYGMQVVPLRYANVYGPRQNVHGEAGVVAIFCNCLRQGKTITVYGDGAQTRDYVFVSDVARANLAATHWSAPPVDSIDSIATNVGTGIETSVNTLVQALFNATGRSVPVQHAPSRPGELLRSSVSVDQGRKRFGWCPEVTLAEGLAQTFEWIQNT